PGKRIALSVGNCDDRVVEGCVNMRDSFGHALLDLLAGARGRRGFLRGLLCHRFFLSGLGLGRSVERDLLRLARALAGPCIGASALTANGQPLAMSHAAIAAEI